VSDLYPIQRDPRYALVDPAIRRWCEEHRLHLYTTNKDYDVRSVDVVGATGKKCQVWIDPPQSGTVTVNVWPFAPPHECITVPVDDIGPALERAYTLAAQFVAANP
jgi:hypothetical protein